MAGPARLFHDGQFTEETMRSGQGISWAMLNWDTSLLNPMPPPHCRKPSRAPLLPESDTGRTEHNDHPERRSPDVRFRVGATGIEPVTPRL